MKSLLRILGLPRRGSAAFFLRCVSQSLLALLSWALSGQVKLGSCPGTFARTLQVDKDCGPNLGDCQILRPFEASQGVAIDGQHAYHLPSAHDSVLSMAWSKSRT